MKRYLNPFDIYVEPDFSISVFASELNSPGSILITDNNKMYITDTGELTGEWNPKQHCSRFAMSRRFS